MKGSCLRAYALTSCVGTALLAGCGGPQPPLGSADALIQTSGGSWTAPEAAAHDLLYISDAQSDDVDIYTYPQAKLVGKLTGLVTPLGLCADRLGNVYVTNNETAVWEYSHGGTTPIRKLTTKGGAEACSVDPISGNLAVVGQILLAIYKNARGKPKYYEYYNPSYSTSPQSCAFDANGNLFVDSELYYASSQTSFALEELADGGNEVNPVWYPGGNRNGRLAPGGVAWDGKNIAVGDEKSGTVYIYDPPGKGSKVTLRQADSIQQFWIQDGTLIGPNFNGGSVMFWKFPSGGDPVKTISGLEQPFGATVSLAGRI